jgi:hypothetical protein
MPEIPLQTTEAPDEFRTILFSWPGTSAGVPEQTTLPIFLADRAYVVDAVWAYWRTAESTAATLNLQLYKVASGVAIEDATKVPVSADATVAQGGATPARINLKGTAATYTAGTILYEEPSGSGVPRNYLAQGDLLYGALVVDAGTLSAATELANLVIGVRVRTRIR